MQHGTRPSLSVRMSFDSYTKAPMAQHRPKRVSAYCSITRKSVGGEAGDTPDLPLQREQPPNLLNCLSRNLCDHSLRSLHQDHQVQPVGWKIVDL